MSIEKNVQIVKDFFAALGRRDKQGLLALSAEDIEWIIPGEDWPLAGTHRGHAGLADVLQKANETVETSYPEPPEFIAQGDRVLVVGFATGRIKATNRTFEDHWVFAITVRNGKLTNVREYIDTQALARALRDGREPQALTQGNRPHDTIRKVYEYVEQRQRLLNRKLRAARKQLLLYHAPRCCGFEPVQSESGYVHRSEDVCYRVQLSLHLLLKARVFCENCTRLNSLAWR